MPLLTSFRGRHLPPFEGDRVVELLGLPADARVRAARATVFPDWPEGGAFSEDVQLTSEGDRFGMTVDVGGDTIVVDFHARRLVRDLSVFAEPATVTDATVYLDLAGMWAALDPDGSLAVPGAPPPFSLTGPLELHDVATSRVRVMMAGATTATLQAVSWRTFPGNVTLRLGAQGPFFVKLGDLTSPQEIPDFAAALSAHLLGAAVEHGHFVVPITLHSDALARLGLVVEIDYTRERSLLPPDVADVALPFSYERTADVQDAAPLAVAVPAGQAVVAGGARGRVAGRFDETRIVLGPEQEPVARKGPQRVGDGVTQAQPIRLERPLAFSALDLLVQQRAEGTELTATLMDDADGKPWGPALLPEPIRFSLRRQLGEGFRWESAPLAEAFQLEARRDDGRPRTYWLVLDADVGSANWAAAAGTTGAELYRSIDKGMSWQEAEILRDPGPLTGLFRLRQVPAVFEMPIELLVGEGALATTRSLERFAASGRVDFALGQELTEAVNTYAAAAGPVPCPRLEHLANGDFAHWLQVDVATETETPEDWTVVGRASRTLLPRFGDAARLREAALVQPPEDRPGALSQVTTCAGGCPYRFEFVGHAELPGAQAQIIWRDAGCGAVRIDALEIRELPDPRSATPEEARRQPLDARLLHRLTVGAPAAATQAEVRFLVPPGNELTLTSVSLIATPELVVNADLAEIGGDGIVGWDTPAGLALALGAGAVVLSNDEPEAATVSQAVAVDGGAAFSLSFTGRALKQGAAAASFKLTWSAATGAAVGEPLVHELSLFALDHHLLEGTTPEGAAVGRLALVLPPGSSLEVTAVSLRVPQAVRVPVSFRAQGPGELTVSGAAVELEDVAPVAVPLPPAGLCPPTPPGARPGPEHVASCPCPACEHHSVPPRRLPSRSADLQRRSTEPVLVVDGIGPARSAQLAALGLTQLGHLATAPIALLAQAPSLSPKGARELRSEAIRLLLHE